MTIKYKKYRNRFYLILCIIWVILTGLNLLFGDKDRWSFWLWIVLGTGYIVVYGYEYYHQYLTIEDGFIYRNTLFPKKLELSKLKKLRKLHGDYILETEEKKLTINISLIDENSFKELEEVLNKYVI